MFQLFWLLKYFWITSVPKIHSPSSDNDFAFQLLLVRHLVKIHSTSPTATIRDKILYTVSLLCLSMTKI